MLPHRRLHRVQSSPTLVAIKSSHPRSFNVEQGDVQYKTAYTNLAALLTAQATQRPAAVALLDGTIQPPRPVSFAELHTAIAQAGAMLRAAGLRRGDRVLLFQPMSLDLYVAFGAILANGMTAVFIDPGMPRSQLDRAAAHLSPQAFLGPPRAHLLRLISPAIRRTPHHFSHAAWLPMTRPWQAYQDHAPLDEFVPCDDDTPALITVTSGTTGMPKFATRTHGFLRSQHAAIDAALAIDPGAVIATSLPVFVLSFLAMGTTTLLPGVDLRSPGRYDVAAFLAQLRATGVTCLAASPALLDRLARYCMAQHVTLLEIKQIYSGGGPVWPDLMDRLQRVAPNASILAVYGATEAEPIATLAYDDLRATDRYASSAGMGLPVGEPVPTIDLRIIPDRWGEPLGPYTQAEWEALALAPTQAGEIVVAGPHVLTSGSGEEAQSTKIQVGERTWHRTGDAGYLDRSGRLWLLGRCAAALPPAVQQHGAAPDAPLRGKLYPLAVEASVLALPEVKYAALVEVDGRRVLALELVTPQTQAWIDALADRVGWANLDAVRVLPRMPVDRRHNAKVDYPALRRLLHKSQ